MPSKKKPEVLKRPAAAEPEEEEPEECDEPVQLSPPSPVRAGRGRGRGRGAAAPPSSPAATRRAANSPGSVRVSRAGGVAVKYEESPATVAARAMKVSTGPASDRGWLAEVKPRTGSLAVVYEAPEGDAPSPLCPGLVRLRNAGQFCDAVIVAGGGRIPVHQVVLAAHSDVLATRLQVRERLSGDAAELDLQHVSHDAVDLLVRWLYSEVTVDTYAPPTPKVNEELLKLSSELGLPKLSELCALRMAANVDTTNVVPRVRLCEQYGLPRLRKALVGALVEDRAALNAVARDPSTLGHPALMREMLASVASQASADTGEDGRDAKRARIGAN